MDRTDKCRKLAEEIVSYFRDGIPIDAHAKAYIDACFPDLSLRDLAERICGEPDFDDAPLMELIFFPGKALQARLESLLEENAFSLGDEDEVTRLLLERSIRTALRESGSDIATGIEIPAAALHSFVRRLGITRQIPRRLIETIHSRFPGAEAVRLKVELRNARFAFSPRIAGFLDCFLRGIDPAAAYFQDCFRLALALPDEQKRESDPFLLPEAKRKILLKEKKTAAEFMRRLQRDNMETLMHRGVRAPETSIEEAERKIELLGHIIDAVETGRASSGTTC